MDLSMYPEEIQRDCELLDRDRKRQGRGYAAAFHRVIRAGRQLGSRTLYGTGCYYAADYCYCRRLEKTGYYLEQAVLNLQGGGDPVLLARTYNLLFIEASTHGSMELSLDYCNKGFLWAQKTGIPDLIGITAFNLATLYNRMGDSKAGAKLCRLCEAMARKCGRSNPYYYMILFYSWIETAYIHLTQNTPDDVTPIIRKAEKLLNEMPEELRNKYGNHPMYPIVLAHYYYEKGDREKGMEMTRRVLSLMRSDDIVTDTLKDIIEFGQYLMSVSELEPLGLLIEGMDPLISRLRISYLRMEFNKVAVHYCQAVDDMKSEKRYAAAYFAADEQLREDRVNDQRIFLRLYRTMEEISRENERLAYLATHDPLTKLANRSSMQDDCDAAFEKAYKEHGSMAVGILDIDDFKTINDTYGHIAGDRCLQAVAKILQDVADGQKAACKMGMTENSISVYRYGGDEFVVLYEGMDDAAVQAVAEKIRGTVSGLSIPADDSRIIDHLTVSQGICRKSPGGLNKVWDLFYSADYALYSVKKEGKNGIRLIHRTQVERQQ